MNWLADNVTVSAPLVLTNRTVIGLVGTKGFQLNGGASVIAGGQPGAPVRLVRVSLVQEGTNGLTGSSFKVFEAATASPPPTVEARFAEFLLPNDPTGRRVLLNDSANAVSSFSLRDCRVTRGTLSFSPPTPSVSQSVTLFNNVFEGAGLYFYRYYDNNLTVSFRHNLVRYGDCWASYYPQTYQNPYWTFKDNLFESASLLNTAGAYLLGGFNGYTAATATFGGSGNKTSLVPDYVAGTLGRYCYPTAGAGSSLTNLLDAGSSSGGAAGLYHYTTLVAGTKETNGPVDIGFHYASPPVDTDGDGLADCLEDVDGDGVTDDGETSFTAYDTDGDGVNDLAEPAGQVVSFGQTWGIGDATANVGTGTSYVAVAAGVGHNLAVRESGQVVGWGGNAYGQTNTPPAATNAVAVAAGDRHSLALAETGVVLAWGDNTWGQTTVPAPNTNFTAITAGYRHSLALKNDGTVRAWGDNGYGQSTVPGGLANVIQVAGGQEHSLSLKADGTVAAWGRNQHGQTTVPGSATGVVEIAAGWTHSLALKSDGTVVAWGDSTAGATTVPAGLTNALHIAAGQNFSVALRNDGTLLAWGSNTSGQTNVPASLTNVQALAAGQARVVTLPHCPVLSYPVDVRRDLLVIYNSNFTDSGQMKDYYLAHRPRVANANVLGVGLDSTQQETLTNSLYPTVFYPAVFYPAVSNWFRANPAKPPAWILLMYGVPTRIANFQVVTEGGSLQNDLRKSLGTHFGRRPWVSALNFYRTNDCRAYVDKLENVGTNNPMNRVILSADKAGISRDTYVVDDVRKSFLFGDTTVGLAKQALLNTGVSPSAIVYRDNYNASDPPVSSATNIINYLSWGGYNGLGWDWATNGNVKFFGNSSWYVAQTIESYNGQWPPVSEGQRSYVDWFSQFSLGGTNWDKTPVAATTTVGEPTTAGVAQPKTWLPLWSIGKPSAQSIWNAQPNLPNYQHKFLQATGDPLIRR